MRERPQLTIMCKDCTTEMRKNWRKRHAKTDLTDCHVKAAFTQKAIINTEYMWVHITQDNGPTLDGILKNLPAFLTNVKYNDRVTIYRVDIMQHYNDRGFTFQQSEDEKMADLEEHLKAH